MTKYQALIFDLDGVLIDSEAVHEKATLAVFAQHNLEVPPSAFQMFRGRTAKEAFAYLIDTYARAPLDVEELLAHKEHTYRNLLDELHLMPGILAFIRRIRPVFKLGLTTSDTRKNQQLVFARFDLDAYFDATITADDTTHAKPHPEPYLATAAKLTVPPTACLVIEDATHGVRAAVRAGCTVAGLTTTFPADALKAAGAHVTIDSIDELAQHLERGQ